MCVIKRDGNAIEFDVQKIIEAITKAAEAMEPAFEEINTMVNEAIDNIRKALYSFAHSLAHWVLHAFYAVTSRIKEAICYDPSSALRLALAVRIQVKILTISFLERTHVYRAAYLIRTQDRSDDENSDSDIANLSLVLAQSL